MAELTDQDVRILNHYAQGAELKSIAAMVGVGREAVMTVVEELAAFDRKKAADVVRREQRRRDSPAAATASKIVGGGSVVSRPEPGVQALRVPAVPAPLAAVLREAPVKPVLAAGAAPTASLLAAGERLAWWDSWLCEACGRRTSVPFTCHGGPAAPITVTLSRRQVSGG